MTDPTKHPLAAAVEPDAPIEERLVAAQLAYLDSAANRRAVVLEAVSMRGEDGRRVYTPYAVAKLLTLGTGTIVPESTVRAILKAAEKPPRP